MKAQEHGTLSCTFLTSYYITTLKGLLASHRWFNKGVHLFKTCDSRVEDGVLEEVAGSLQLGIQERALGDLMEGRVHHRILGGVGRRRVRPRTVTS